MHEILTNLLIIKEKLSVSSLSSFVCLFSCLGKRLLWTRQKSSAFFLCASWKGKVRLRAGAPTYRYLREKKGRIQGWKLRRKKRVGRKRGKRQKKEEGREGGRRFCPKQLRDFEPQGFPSLLRPSPLWKCFRGDAVNWKKRERRRKRKRRRR